MRILESSLAPVSCKAGVGGGGVGSSEDGGRVTAVPLSSTGVLEEGERRAAAIPWTITSGTARLRLIVMPTSQASSFITPSRLHGS
ncbi:unnamed protein product [Ectocarpus fasciculatus]